MRWLFLIVLVACGSDGKPAIDAAAQTIDADVCATAADCPCFSNYDCPPTHACRADSFLVWCMSGPRGTGAPGTLCTSGDDCASALCVDDASNVTQRCSDVCRTSATCPPELPRCIALGEDGICAREPPSQ